MTRGSTTRPVDFPTYPDGRLVEIGDLVGDSEQRGGRWQGYITSYTNDGVWIKMTQTNSLQVDREYTCAMRHLILLRPARPPAPRNFRKLAIDRLDTDITSKSAEYATLQSKLDVLGHDLSQMRSQKALLEAAPSA